MGHNPAVPHHTHYMSLLRLGTLVDWWHLATVVVLALALVGEAVAAYCAQKARFEARHGRVPLKPRRYRWARLWRKEVDSHGGQENRENVIPSELGPVVRGLSRLAVALVFLVRFAAGQPPPWSM